MGRRRGPRKTESDRVVGWALIYVKVAEPPVNATTDVIKISTACFWLDPFSRPKFGASGAPRSHVHEAEVAPGYPLAKARLASVIADLTRKGSDSCRFRT